jgi:parallel beta-helix repeat protein
MSARSSAIVLGVLLAVRASSHAATIIVPDDNPSVRDAVANAAPGDIVQIRPGVYGEGMKVDNHQVGLTIEGLGGRPVIAPPPGDDGVRVKEVDGVTVRGLEVQGGQRAVRSDGGNLLTVDDVIGTGNKEGVRIKIGNGHVVQNCVLTGATGGRGIRLDLTGGAQIIGNTLSGNRKEGIRATKTVGTLLQSNTVTGSSADGIRLKGGLLDTIDGNTSDQNARSGIRVIASPSLTITGNGADANAQYGIRIQKSPPVASTADLTGAGNTATGNGISDLRVQ